MTMGTLLNARRKEKAAARHVKFSTWRIWPKVDSANQTFTFENVPNYILSPKILSDQFDSFSMADFWLVEHNFSVIRPNENSTNRGSHKEQAGSRLTQRMDVFHSCDERIASKLNFGFVVSGQSSSLCQGQSLANRTLYFTLAGVSLFSIGSIDAPCVRSALANLLLKKYFA